MPPKTSEAPHVEFRISESAPKPENSELASRGAAMTVVGAVYSGPGIAHSPSRLYASDLHRALPDRIRASTILTISPGHSASSASHASRQRFAFGFLRIRSRPRHPCRSATTPSCQAWNGLAPSSECALPGAPRGRAELAPRPSSHPSCESARFARRRCAGVGVAANCR